MIKQIAWIEVSGIKLLHLWHRIYPENNQKIADLLPNYQMDAPYFTSPTFDDKITTSPTCLHFHFTFSRTVQLAFHKSQVYATLLFVNQTEDELFQIVQFFQMSWLVWYTI